MSERDDAPGGSRGAWRAWVAFALALAASAGAVVGLRVALEHVPLAPTGAPAASPDRGAGAAGRSGPTEQVPTRDARL
jgi:hypothetical protein